MRHRPPLVDLFCGAGGVSMGYHRAGFEVWGVDSVPQPRYPWPHRFILGDAYAMMADRKFMSRFVAAHASPPCQRYTISCQTQRAHGKEYPDSIPPTRAALQATGLLWVIENVKGAPLRADYRLCGCQFGLDLRRERWFETSWGSYDLMPPCYHPHPVPSVVGHGTPAWVRNRLGYNPTFADAKRSMGIDWMNRDELSQAIPPAYTQFIGGHLMAALGSLNAA